jgi:amino-acid N-acetyltransferase
MNSLIYRRAKPTDARAIVNLIQHYSAKGVMLPRPYAQILEKIRDFVVAVEDESAVIRGIVALHVVGEDLAEIRSLAVDETCQGQGVGRKMLDFCLSDAKDLDLQRVFALTYQTEFFTKLGFLKVEKLTLPQKIWGDCVHCAKFSDCDEIAMLLTLSKS